MLDEHYCEKCQETKVIGWPEVVSFAPDHGYEIEFSMGGEASTGTVIGWAVTERHQTSGDGSLIHERSIYPVFYDEVFTDPVPADYAMKTEYSDATYRISRVSKE